LRIAAAVCFDNEESDEMTEKTIGGRVVRFAVLPKPS